MQWLLALEIDNDTISLCRLMNNFRRKGIRLTAFWLAAANSGFEAMAVMETPESEVNHLFHFLRRSEGVEHVSAYLPASAQGEVENDAAQHGASASYVFVKGRLAGFETLARENFAGLKVVFAGQDQFLLELRGDIQARFMRTLGSLPGDFEFVHFCCTKTTRLQAVSELVA